MSKRFASLIDLRPERVCLIKPSSLGDIVHALPVLSSLRALWPESRFSWVVNRGFEPLLHGHPDLDETIPFDRGLLRSTVGGLGSLGGFVKELRARRFELAIDLQGLFRSGAMSFATGASIRVGASSAREGSTYFYTHQVPSPTVDEGHAVDRLLKIASAFGADVSRPRFTLPLSLQDRRWAKTALDACERPRLALNLGARWLTKRWPPAHFAEIARRAFQERSASLIVVGAPEDEPMVEAFRASLGKIPFLDLHGKTSLPRLASVFAEVDAVVSNDTGPLHLAAAVGTFVVGIYTCTRPELTGPYGSEAVSVTTQVGCAGSCLTKCGDLICMRELSPDRVWRALSPKLTLGGDRRSMARGL